jgi:AraC-like DNA-binding protein
MVATRSELERVLERRRAVALSQHYRYQEDLSIGQIADRLGRSPSTIKAYFYDPTGEKAKAVKARYVGLCRGCGAYTQPRNGKGDAYRYCKRCHPGTIAARWTRELVLEAMREWRDRCGSLPSSYDWSPTQARRRGGAAARRLSEGQWPAASVITALFGTWAAARRLASRRPIDRATGSYDGICEPGRGSASPGGVCRTMNLDSGSRGASVTLFPTYWVCGPCI